MIEAAIAWLIVWVLVGLVIAGVIWVATWTLGLASFAVDEPGWGLAIFGGGIILGLGWLILVVFQIVWHASTISAVLNGG